MVTAFPQRFETPSKFPVVEISARGEKSSKFPFELPEKLCFVAIDTIRHFDGVSPKFNLELPVKSIFP
jgi:hypothetical protein